jgi:hypothetical protein
MSAPAGKPAKPLRYVDPAEFTPHFAWRNSKKRPDREVFCEDVSLAEIVARFATPAYVYSRAAIESAFRDLDRGLGSLPHALCFAVKSNGNLSILKLLAQLGSGFDIVSGGELEHLGHLGVSGDKIVFSGWEKPVKRFARLSTTVRAAKRSAGGYCSSTSNLKPSSMFYSTSLRNK